MLRGSGAARLMCERGSGAAWLGCCAAHVRARLVCECVLGKGGHGGEPPCMEAHDAGWRAA